MQTRGILGCLAVTVFCSLIAGGCSSSTPTTSVSGVVTAVNPKSMKKEVITFGTITFVNMKTQKKTMGNIAEGKYTLTGIETGLNKVIVTTTTAPLDEPITGDDPNEAVDKKAKKKKWFPLPGRYASESLTPLSAEVKAGTQNFDFHLTPKGK